MAEPLELRDFETLAPDHMSAMAWGFLSSAAADGHTRRWNEEAYQRIRIMPRHLVDVSRLDTRARLLGLDLAHPILLAPVSYQKLLIADGELSSVRGAGDAEAAMVVSSFATVTLEEIAEASKVPLWFQLYIQPDRDFTRDLVKRAEKAGYKALVVTVDSPILGARYEEQRVGFKLPPGLVQANLKGLKTATGDHRPKGRDIYSPVLDPALTWKGIEWLRSLTSLPIVLKGVLNPADARRSLEAGVSGLIVSNHGGRNLDTVPASIDALPGVVAGVDGKIPVLVDGGIRRGTDVLKAIALGASAVLIGRPYVYGLAVAGSQGVTRVVEILRREFEMAMALSGRASISEIDASVIMR
jgi:4-hydroxymandelate oxidase